VNRGAPERIFAACSPGLEPALARELGALGLSARTVAGGVEAEGRDARAVACLGSRAADAVKARLWEGPASGVAEARRGLARRFPGVDLEARREGDRSTLSADAAGAPLFKRGWRARVGAAPLRESLAAGLLLELGFDGSVPFLDPMCGSGTIPIEAALLAGRRAPGLGRTFAFEGWPGHDPARTREVRERFAALSRDPPAPVLGSDRNGGAVRLAGKNADAAGMAGFVRIERRDASDVEPPPGPGVCLVNPPYGIRLDREVEESGRSLGALVARLSGWTVGVLAGDPAIARLLPGRPARSLEVQNGGIRCRFLVYQP
jgi:putative N6-adenine-specific DNA methylase